MINIAMLHLNFRTRPILTKSHEFCGLLYKLKCGESGSNVQVLTPAVSPGENLTNSMQDKSQFSVRIHAATEMKAFLPQWQFLSDNAAEDNVYYSPAFATALLDTVAIQQKVRFLTVWRGEELAGLLPFTQPRFRGFGLRTRAWETLYTFNCLPLLSSESTQEVARELITAARNVGGADWVLPQVRVNGPVHSALGNALSDVGAVYRDILPFRRAFLEGGNDFEHHMVEVVGAKRRRDLGRNRRKLEELGKVSHEIYMEGESLGPAVEVFLELERSGWKGRKGTALACKTDTREFALRAFRNVDGAKTRVDLLLLDGKPIAAGVIVFSGSTGFTIKGAYDEAYARNGVGLLLEIEILKSFLGENWTKRLDSATAGEHAIDALWPGRMEIADLAFSFSSIAPGLRIEMYERLAIANRKLRGNVKRLLKMD